jgi:formylglycine-generating enzyme required for sulfatase activity
VLAAKARWVSLIEPEMVELPSDDFLMGPPTRIDKAYSVTVPAFAIGKYELTFDEYDVFVFATGARRPGDMGWGRGQRPVINVSWLDAKAYVEWLSRTTGKQYRLPSEAEWEYAARAGANTRYWWGDDAPTRERANVRGYVDETTQAGEYPANPWGLYDMDGNVWEWVEDCWHASYEGAPRDGTAWTGNCDLEFDPYVQAVPDNRVARSHAWNSYPDGSTSRDDRSRPSADVRANFLGFRVARTLSRSNSVTP